MKCDVIDWLQVIINRLLEAKKKKKQPTIVGIGIGSKKQRTEKRWWFIIIGLKKTKMREKKRVKYEKRTEDKGRKLSYNCF